MSRGKYLSLEEARNEGKLDQFAKEHPSEADADRFARLLEAVTQGLLEGQGTSSPDDAAGSTGTRTPRGKSASGAKKRGRASRE